MKNKVLTSFTKIPRIALIATAIVLVVGALMTFFFARTFDREPTDIVTRGVANTLPSDAAEAKQLDDDEKSSQTQTQTITSQCSDEECTYTEDTLYEKGRLAAQKIVDAQNAFATMTPNTDEWEKNQRTLDKYLTGLESYSIDENGSRFQSTARHQWFPSKKKHTWQLPADSNETKYNALIDRGFSIICVDEQGEILSEVFLGWGDPHGSTLTTILDTQQYSPEDDKAVQAYLDNEYLSFTYFQQSITAEGAAALLGDS